MEGNWVECVVDTDYEISDVYPYPIRRKGKTRIISEDVHGGYVRCSLNAKSVFKHTIIARQFIPNPDNLPEVDHINTNRLDNRIENLRWVTKSENIRNRGSANNVTYTYLDELPEGSESLESYGKHDLDGYFINTELEKVYVWNGARYRELYPVVVMGSIAYSAVNTEGKKIRLYHRQLF